MDRRTFLATPLVFGLRDLLAQDEPQAAEWWPAALRRMKESDRYGIVLVSRADERARQAMGLVLNRILTENPAGAHQVFAGAVVACLTPQLADGRVRKPGERENRFLLAPDGTRVAADEMAWPEVSMNGSTAGNLDGVVEGLRAFLHGEKGERLARHAERIEKGLTEEIQEAIRALDAEDFEARARATARVTKEASPIAPYLVRLASTDPSLERRWRADAAVKEAFQAADPQAPGPRLPWGCAGQREFFDPCPYCGLGRAPEGTRYFLRILSK